MAIGIFFVMLAIMMVIRGVKLLGLAASGAVATGAVSALLGFTLLGLVPWLLPFTAFMTVLWSLSRAYRDHEMDIWMSSGLSLFAWIRPVLLFAVPLALLSALLSLGLTPWAYQKSREYREIMARREDVSTVAPGIFKESSANDQVYYVENFGGPSGHARSIFVKSHKDGQDQITVADEGYLLSLPDGERWVVLNRGRRYEGNKGGADYRITEFAESRIRVEEGPPQITSPDTSAAPSLTLWRSRVAEHQAELARRFAVPISTLVLALAAIPLAFVNPRVGRGFNVILAVLVFSIYFNLLTIATSWLSDGRLSLAVNLWPIHGGMLLFAALLFWWRLRPRY